MIMAASRTTKTYGIPNAASEFQASGRREVKRQRWLTHFQEAVFWTTLSCVSLCLYGCCFGRMGNLQRSRAIWAQGHLSPPRAFISFCVVLHIYLHLTRPLIETFQSFSICLQYIIDSFSVSWFYQHASIHLCLFLGVLESF